MSDADHKPPSLPNLELLRLIGEGSYGQVWMARTVLRSYVAVKVVERARFADQRHYEREFQSVCKYELVSRGDPSQLRLLSAGRDEAAGFFYYTMELADDLHLGRVIDPETYAPATLKGRLDIAGRLPSEECIGTGLALSSALQHLHSKGLVHRDIKPSNIVFVEGLPKLADIGLVTTAGEARSFVGTTDYIAPEGPGSAAADVFALGKTLYRMVTGLNAEDYPKLPPNYENVPDLEVRQELMVVCLKACARTLAERHESAASLNAELALLRAGKSVRRQRAQERFMRRFRRLILFTIVGGLFPALIAGVAWWSARREILLREAQQFRVASQLGWTENSRQRLATASWPFSTEAQRKERATLLSALDYRIIVGTNEGWAKIAAWSLAFDPTDHRLLIGGSSNAPARVWDRDTGRLEFLSTSNRGPVAWDAGGQPLQLLLQTNGDLVVHELRAAQTRKPFRWAAPPPSHPHTETTLAMSLRGEYVAAAWHHPDGRGAWSVWRAADGKVLTSTNKPATALTFDAETDSLAIGFSDGTIEVLDLASTSRVTWLQPARLGIYSLAFGRAGQEGLTNEAASLRRLAAGDASGGIYICDLNDGVIHTLGGSRFHVHALAFSPDGSMLASAGRGEVRWWDAATGRQILSFRGTNVATDNAHALAFTGDGQLLALGTDKYAQAGGAAVLERMDASVIRTLRGLPSSGSRVWFSRDSRWLAALSVDWKLAVFDLKTGVLSLRLDMPVGETADNAAVAFELEASHMAASAGKEARLWDLKSGQLLTNWNLPWGFADKLIYTPERRLWLLRREVGAEVRPFPTWLVRELQVGANPIMVSSQKDFSYRPVDHEFGPGGNFFSLRGRLTSGTGVTVRTIETLTGTEIWGTNYGAREVSLTTSPEGDWGVIEWADVPDRWLVSLPTGRLDRVLPRMGHRLSPDRKWLAWISEEGCHLAPIDDLANHVTLGIAFGLPGVPEFSLDGKLLAWGTASGAVLVADVGEVWRRLKQSR